MRALTASQARAPGLSQADDGENPEKQLSDGPYTDQK